LLDDLVNGLYFPMALLTEESKGLRAVMDVACPVAEAFGLSAEALWQKGVKRIAEIDHRKRARIKTLLRGMKLYKRKRKPVDKSLAELKLGQLKALGLTTENKLELAILSENTLEMMRWRREWIPHRRRGAPLRDDKYGALLAPSGWILRKNVTREEFTRLMDLDAKAAAQPESISGDELEWVRELLGLPALELAEMTAAVSDLAEVTEEVTEVGGTA
jgi:hypothetical protein